MDKLLKHNRCAFTILELVVVMILGVLAAIAAPKFLGALDGAVDGTLEQTLHVIRSAIERFAAEHGDILPGADGFEATFKNDLAPYLRGNEFPVCPVGDAQNNSVYMLTGSGSIAAARNATKETHGWLYKVQTGEFVVNTDILSADEARTYDKF